MSLPNDPLPASEIPRVGFRDQAAAWKVEIQAVSTNAEQWKSEQDLEIAALLAARYANNQLPEAMDEAQIAGIVAETAAAFQRADGIVHEMLKSNFLGLDKSSYRDDRLKMGALIIGSSEGLMARYNNADSYQEKQELVEGYSQASPEMMKNVQLAGAGNAALASTLPGVLIGASAHHASGMNRNREQQLLDEEMEEEQAQEMGAKQAQAQAAQAQQQRGKQEQAKRQRLNQRAQAKSQKKTMLSGKKQNSTSPVASSISKRAKKTAIKACLGGTVALGGLGCLSQWLS